MADRPKYFDAVLEAAFMAGVRHGAGYPELAAIPQGMTEVSFQAWLDDWHGDTWTKDRWLLVDYRTWRDSWQATAQETVVIEGESIAEIPTVDDPEYLTPIQREAKAFGRCVNYPICSLGWEHRGHCDATIPMEA